MRYGRTFPARPLIIHLGFIIIFYPSNPSGLTVTAADGSTTLSLSWTNGNNTFTNTRVEVSNDGSTGWAEIAQIASPATSTTHAVGTNSTTRYYRVRAYNSTTGFFSGYSAVVSATTAPAAPTIGAVTGLNASNSIIVNFTDNSSDETTFGVERSNDGATGWSEVGTTATSPYTDASVGARDTRRYYRVRAKRSGDTINSSYSSTGNGYSAPADPTALAFSNGSTTAALTWTNNSSTNSAFSLERQLGSGAFSVVATPASSPYTDTGPLVAETAYGWKIRAYRASDGIYSDYSTTLTVTTGLSASSTLTCGCVDETVAASKVQCVWDSNTTKDNGFRLQRSTDNATWSTVTTTAAGVMIYTDTGLTANATYYYRVAPVNAAGVVGDYTTGVAVKTSKGTVGDLNIAFNKKLHTFPPQ